MALLIIRVRSMPDAPTRVPATMRRLLFKVKPEAATARPVNELSSEIRTGTSAPPMGRTKMIPRASERTRTTTSRAVLAVTTVAMSDGQDGQTHGGVDRLLARVGDGPPRHELLELGEGHTAAGEGDGADEDAEEDLADLVDGEGLAREGDELGHRDQGRGATAHAVEDGHHLGHRRHLHVAGRRHPDGRADDDGDDDEDEVPGVAVDRRQGEGPGHGHEHPRRPGQVPGPGVLGRAQPDEGEDEADDGDQIDEIGGGGPAHGGRAPEDATGRTPAAPASIGRWSGLRLGSAA